MVSSAKGVKARPESPFFWNGTNDHEKYRSFSVRSYLSNKAKTRPERFPCVKELVRWATGKRLTDRLPKQSLITLAVTPTNLANQWQNTSPLPLRTVNPC